MTGLVRALPLIVLLAGASAQAADDPAHGGGEHDSEQHHGIDAKTLGLQLFNFAALLFILVKFGGGAVNRSLRARYEQMKADLDEANTARSAAQARFAEQEKRLTNLELEIGVMQANVAREAEQEKARIIAGAEEKAKRIQDETRFQLDQQVKEAQLRFRAEVAGTAVKIAEELLRRAINPADEQRLSQLFVAELVAGRGAGPDAALRPSAPAGPVT